MTDRVGVSFNLDDSAIQELARYNDSKTQQIQELKDEVNSLKEKIMYNKIIK